MLKRGWNLLGSRSLCYSEEQKTGDSATSFRPLQLKKAFIVKSASSSSVEAYGWSQEQWKDLPQHPSKTISSNAVRTWNPFSTVGSRALYTQLCLGHRSLSAFSYVIFLISTTFLWQILYSFYEPYFKSEEIKNSSQKHSKYSFRSNGEPKSLSSKI